MKVMKFGGSSVANAENIRKVADIVINTARDHRCIVVLSALQGTTDALIAAARAAEQGDETFRAGLSDLRKRHTNTAGELIPAAGAEQIIRTIENFFAELESVCEGVFLLRELSARSLDKILSFGELLSSQIFAATLSSLEIENEWKDSRDLIRTDSSFGCAATDFQETNSRILRFAQSTDSNLIILPGFIASDGSGVTTTLGRGGSDYTAAIVAAAVNAEVLEIWTDVSGMMTADPRFVRSVRQIPKITYREAMELSHFGAKVIYPPTIHPVMSRGIPILVKNTFSPDAAGTLIESETSAGKDIIRGITSIDKIAVLNLEGSGMVGIPGFSKRLFDALSRERINVILITQSSSEHSICVAIEDRFGRTAKEAVDREFEHEIDAGKIDPLRVENGFSILAVVGDNMKSHTGVSGRMFATLGHNGINIHAIAQGSSERNISTIISSSDVKKAVNTLHEEFFSDGKKQINLFIAGTGTVGRKLLEQIRTQHEYVAENLRLNLRVVGVANSRRALLDENGIDLSGWPEALEISDKSNKLAREILEKNLRNSIFVDVTACADVVEDYAPLLKKSVSIVACNKIACSSNYENYTRFKELAREFNTGFFFETNVGAGLPIIGTLNDLTQSGDRINRIDAVLSGTLNFVFNNYDGSRDFAGVVRQAQSEGYTEPDPRLDLSGTDVARKILILAREAGQVMEMDNIQIASFLPASCLAGSVEDFYDEMSRHEPHFRALLDEARDEGKFLKYIATFENGSASVGLQKIGPEHNFAGLSGKDNAVMFYTNRYSEQPLVVKGAGAGADVTAAGVFADIIRAAR